MLDLGNVRCRSRVDPRSDGPAHAKTSLRPARLHAAAAPPAADGAAAACRRAGRSDVFACAGPSDLGSTRDRHLTLPKSNIAQVGYSRLGAARKTLGEAASPSGVAWG